MRRFFSILLLGWGWLVQGFSWGATDTELSQLIRERLKGSPLLMARKIRVEVREGRASIAGEVAGLDEVLEARDLAEKVTGVRELDLELSIIVDQPTDTNLAAKVKRNLDLNPKLQSEQLKVQVEGGVVTLSGRIQDARLRFDARDAAAGIRGVREIVDRLDTPEQEDAAILRGLRSLLSNRALERIRGEYEPSVMEGIVTLEGKAPRLWERRMVERAAWGLNGVKKVINLITVVPADKGVKVISPGDIPARPPANPD